ncbi:MAG TPA: hypothetical protein VGN35_03980 [Jatrophihabitantaceae bacterium]|jgi:hypothetical protein|nr:hypothetical protein [Jatrophihabitantaceae bacterium]
MNATTVTIELTEDELHLVKNALHALQSDFGHDEADVVQAIRNLLDKLGANADQA